MKRSRRINQLLLARKQRYSRHFSQQSHQDLRKDCCIFRVLTPGRKSSVSERRGFITWRNSPFSQTCIHISHIQLPLKCCSTTRSRERSAQGEEAKLLIRREKGFSWGQAPKPPASLRSKSDIKDS
jgi:hypothetical protein